MRISSAGPSGVYRKMQILQGSVGYAISVDAAEGRGKFSRSAGVTRIGVAPACGERTGWNGSAVEPGAGGFCGEMASVSEASRAGATDAPGVAVGGSAALVAVAGVAVGGSAAVAAVAGVAVVSMATSVASSLSAPSANVPVASLSAGAPVSLGATGGAIPGRNGSAWRRYGRDLRRGP